MTFYIAISLLLCIFIYKSYREIRAELYNHNSLDKTWWFVFAPLLLAFLSLVVTGVFAAFSNIDCLKEEVGRTSLFREIYSLRNDQQTSGGFLLGTGSINTSEYYFTFVKDERGGLIRNQVPAWNAYLFLTNEKSPRFEWQIIHYRPKKWFFPWDVCEDIRTMYDIFVPEGTIIEKFSIQ